MVGVLNWNFSNPSISNTHYNLGALSVSNILSLYVLVLKICCAIHYYVIKNNVLSNALLKYNIILEIRIWGGGGGLHTETLKKLHY